MAHLEGLIRKMNGSVGDFTFKQVKGQTVVSEKVTHVANPRTEGQMRQRCKWTNIGAMFRGIRPLLNDGFENKSGMQTDYNMFMKLNLQKTPVYLTKQQVAGGACIAAPYQITFGTLNPIQITGEGNSAATDIFLGGLSLTASTTVAEFSQAVISNNPDYRNGDQLSFFLVKQKVDDSTKIPYCQFKASKVILDVTNTEVKLWSIVNKNGFYTQDGCIGKYGSDGDCAFGWVHSRKENGKTRVSTQSLIASNSLLSTYQGDIAFGAAALSYGNVKDVFLAPSGTVSSTVSGGGAGTGGATGGGGDSL